MRYFCFCAFSGPFHNDSSEFEFHRFQFLCIQLFRERLSYKRGKAYSTMSKVIMGNGGFYGSLIEPQGVLAWWEETAQTRVFRLSRFLLLNHLETQSSKSKLLLHITPIGIVAYSFTLLWDNLCRNSCTLYSSRWPIQELMGNYFPLRVSLVALWITAGFSSYLFRWFSVAEMSSGKVLRVKFSRLERNDGCGAFRIASIERGNDTWLW